MPWPWRRMWSWEASKWYINNTRTEQARSTLEGHHESSALPLVTLKLPPQHAHEGVQMQTALQSQPLQLSQQPSQQLSQSPPAAVAVAAGSDFAVPAIVPVPPVSHSAASAPCEAKLEESLPSHSQLKEPLEGNDKADPHGNPLPVQPLSIPKATKLSRELPVPEADQQPQLSELSQPSQLPQIVNPPATKSLSVAYCKATSVPAQPLDQAVTKETAPKMVPPRAVASQQLLQRSAPPPPKAVPQVVPPPPRPPTPRTLPQPVNSKGRQRYFYETATYADQAHQYIFCKKFNDDRGCNDTGCPKLHGCDNMLSCGRPCSLPHPRYAHELVAHGQLQPWH